MFRALGLCFGAPGEVNFNACGAARGRAASDELLELLAAIAGGRSDETSLPPFMQPPDLALHWLASAAQLVDHDYKYRSFNAVHIAAANAAPLNIVNRLLRVGGSDVKDATCSVTDLQFGADQGAAAPLGHDMQPIHVAIKSDASDETVQLFLQIGNPRTKCTCTVWGQRREYTPLELAQHHQKPRVTKLLTSFFKNGNAACESAQLVAATLRLLVCYLCEEYELDYDATVVLADVLAPPPLDMLLRFVRQGFAWHGGTEDHAAEVAAEMRTRLGEEQSLGPGLRVILLPERVEATVVRVDPGPPARLRLEWAGGQSGWRKQRDVERLFGLQLGFPPYRCGPGMWARCGGPGERDL